MAGPRLVTAFTEQGLVIVEPRILRATVPPFFGFALSHSREIEACLAQAAQRLAAAGYTPLLTSEQAGGLYTFDPTGRRVRVSDPQTRIRDAVEHPESYSTDAALRPLFADAALPVVVSVLGPGEIDFFVGGIKIPADYYLLALETT